MVSHDSSDHQLFPKIWSRFIQGFYSELPVFRASHLINTVASAVFGLIYIYLWKGVTPVSGFNDYSALTIVQYISFNQTTLWFTQFGVRTQVRIVDAVRSGNIATELIRPMDYLWYMMSSSFGWQSAHFSK